MLKTALCRVFKVALALYCCLNLVLSTIWLALPSPSFSNDERTTYIQNTLAAGQPVIAAWDIGPIQKTYRRPTDPNWCPECTSVLFHWQFTRLYNKVQILLAPHDSYHRDRPFEVASRFESARAWNNGRNNDWSPYFVDLYSVTTVVPAGRQDEHISQSWFNEVDRHLIQHTFLGWKADVDIRAVIPEPGVVEFWSGAAIDRAFACVSEVWDGPLKKGYALENRTWTPAVYKQMRADELDMGLVASFEADVHSDVKDIVVRQLKGNLPSRTWPIRQKMLLRFSRFIVGPIMLFKEDCALLAPHFASFLVTLAVVLTSYVGMVCYFWISAGCPNVRPWLSQFWMTRVSIPRRWREVEARRVKD